MANTFGARLLRAWIDKGFRLSRLTEITGCTLEQIPRLEFDESQPSMLSSARDIAATLSVDPGWLIYGDEYHAGEMLRLMREQTDCLHELLALARAAKPDWTD
ncbi:helix-turn-helix domain-containing protein [Delftia sp. PS-11]|uniref:helix-turn-helix domain-containing protein n=1 Tax=Delftia sp. PS-11 TaxID=2767222 RepID=UPI002453B3EF|nr:hypothetical protein [Delftia sp. PS-11]KAJ8741792.1 hypothetical protein H9T68_20740 [Delftia sp. PS-11]